MESSMSRLSVAPALRPKLETNVYRVRNDTRAVFRYAVTIDKVIIKPKLYKTETIQLSRAGGMDAIRIPRQRVCCAILQYVSKAFADATLLYEGAATLFTNLEIDLIDKEIKVDEIESLIEDGDFKMHIRDATKIVVKITAEQGMQDITEIVKKSVEEDQMIVDFLATLAKEHAPAGKFVAFRGGKLIDIEQKSIKEISFGQMRLPGISMGIRAVRNEQEGGVPAMALDIDVTEATHFKAQPLVNTICEYFGAKPLDLKNHYCNSSTMRDVERYIRDIPVRYEHTNKVFTITGFKWGQNMQEVDAWSSEVCRDELEVRKYAGSAVVTEDFKGRDAKVTRYYPLDGLHVLPYTRVPKEKQKGKKPRPVFPQDRYNAMQKARKDINIVTQNETMEKFGTSIDKEPIRVDLRRLDAPKIFGESSGRMKELRVDQIKHNWKSDEARFTKGAKIDELFFVYQEGQLSYDQMVEYATAHTTCCRTKGMEVVRYNGKGVKTHDDLSQVMEQFCSYREDERSKEGKDDYKIFLVLLGEKNSAGFNDWHDRLKSLEQKNAVQTQHVSADVVKKILGKPASARARDFTLFNIVMKTNVKAGGENIKIGQLVGNSLFPSNDANSPITLIVGLDVAHPPPLTRHQLMRGIPADPSCIGISSNCMTNKLQTFIGYEVYTESRKEAATDSIMTAVGAHLIKKFIENHDHLPSNVVYFRDGVDKGQYSRVKDEFDWMMDGMRNHLNLIGLKDEFKPREVVILATKRHNIRAYEVTKSGVQNCKAGTIIDQGIVSPYYPEFFLYASHALIGTAKGVQCTIMRDSSEDELKKYPDIKLKDMEKFVHALAFGHQICDSPTSLPEPLYNAHETAKRGSTNHKVFKNSLEVRPLISTEELTKQLSNRDSELGKVKYNA